MILHVMHVSKRTSVFLIRYGRRILGSLTA
jgi:hypothetical protein